MKRGGKSDARDSHGSLVRQASSPVLKPPRSSSQPPRSSPLKRSETDKLVSAPSTDAIISYVDDTGRPHYYDVATGDIYTGAPTSSPTSPTKSKPSSSSSPKVASDHSLESPSLSGLAVMAAASKRLHPSPVAVRQESSGPVSIERSSLDAPAPSLTDLAILAQSSRQLQPPTQSPPPMLTSSSQRSFFSSSSSRLSRSQSPPSRLPSFNHGQPMMSSLPPPPSRSNSKHSLHPTLHARTGSRARLRDEDNTSHRSLSPTTTSTTSSSHLSNTTTTTTTSSSALARSNSKGRLAVPSRSDSRIKTSLSPSKEPWKLFGRSKQEDKKDKEIKDDGSVEARTAKIDQDMKKLRAKRHSWVNSLRGDNDFAATQRKIKELEAQKAELEQKERASVARLENLKSARNLLEADRQLAADSDNNGKRRPQLEKLAPVSSDSLSDSFAQKVPTPSSNVLSVVDANGNRISNAEYFELNIQRLALEQTRSDSNVHSNNNNNNYFSSDNNHNNNQGERPRSDSNLSTQSDMFSSLLNNSNNAQRRRDDSLGSRSDIVFSPTKSTRMKDVATQVYSLLSPEGRALSKERSHLSSMGLERQGESDSCPRDPSLSASCSSHLSCTPASSSFPSLYSDSSLSCLSSSSSSSFPPPSSSSSFPPPSSSSSSSSMTEISERIMKLLASKHDSDTPSGRASLSGNEVPKIDVGLGNDDDTRVELTSPKTPAFPSMAYESGSTEPHNRLGLGVETRQGESAQTLLERKLKEHLKREQSLKDQLLKCQLKQQILKSQLDQTAQGISEQQQISQQLVENLALENTLKESLAKEDAVKDDLMLERESVFAVS